jgi:hypothetical protein
MGETIQSGLVAHIFCREREGTSTGRYGSGYLIGPDLILTAVHNLMDVTGAWARGEAPGPPSRDALVRLQHDKERLWPRRVRFLELIPDTRSPADRGWARAVLVWPPPGETIHYDVAVLQVDSGEANFSGPALWEQLHVRPAFGRLERHNMEIAIEGYPDLASSVQDLKKNFNLRPYEGVTEKHVERTQRPLLSITRGGTAATAEGWKGLSGAAVWRGDAIVGVVHAAEDKTALNEKLFYESIAPLVDVASFRAMAGLSFERSRPVDHIALLDTLDRTSEVRTFRRKVIDAFPADLPPRAPRFVILPGHERDGMSLCIRRFARDVLAQGPTGGRSDASAGAQHYGREIRIPLGQSSSGIAGFAGASREDRAFEALSAWAGGLCTDPELAIPTHLDQLKDAILECQPAADASRLLILEHITETFEEDCLAVISNILEVVLRLPPMAPPVYVFMSMLMGHISRPDDLPIRKEPYTKKPEQLVSWCLPQLERFLSGLGVRPDIGVLSEKRLLILLPAPGDCLTADAEEWIRNAETLSGRKFDRRDTNFRTYRELTRNPQFPLLTARDTLESLTWETTS